MTRVTGEHTAWAWVVVVLLVGGAWYGLPRYMATLERSIVFADPDCMQVTVDRVSAAGLTLAERIDSTEAWTKGCLEERQERVFARANLVGWSANGLIALGILVAGLVTRAWLSAPEERP